MLLKIRTDEDPILREVAKPVEQGADRRVLIEAMFRTMLEHRGLGLAAPQVGVSERILIAQVKGVRIVLINPQIVATGRHRAWNREGCLSIPGKFVGVRRYDRVVVTGWDEHWAAVKLEARHLTATVIQHELDHLDGKLMTDGEVTDARSAIYP